MTTARALSQVFEEFLADQKARISLKTFLKCQSIIGLDESYRLDAQVDETVPVRRRNRGSLLDRADRAG
jgi:hypothetical protein